MGGGGVGYTFIIIMPICAKQCVGGEDANSSSHRPSSHLVPPVLTSVYYYLTSIFTKMVIQSSKSFFFVVPYAKYFHNFYFGSEGIFDADA